MELELYNKLNLNKLTEVQNKILNKNQNIIIISSCGSGKTEASYLNMLKTNRKIIFIEPMRTLANNIHCRLNKYNEILGLDKVTIQHSSDNSDKFLSSKYCVTTIDQVLSGYLALGRQSFIKGKNILKSNLIFDEVQLFDTDKMMLTTINMLDELNKNGNRFTIMTATMPEYLVKFLKERYNMKVIITNEERKDREVNLYYNKKLDYAAINKNNNKQIIICNTIKELQEVYNNLDKHRVIVLHSKFLLDDRKKIEERVVEYFGKDSNDNNKILLTTQVVEAGMDISANILYSAICPIDNLVQRDGRCCRWGGNGRVVVYESKNNIYNEEIVNRTRETIKKYNGIKFNWSIQKQWINDILNPFYKNKITLKQLKLNKLQSKYCKRENLIRDIQTVNLIVYKNENINKEDFKRYSISIYLNELKKLADNNDLYILKKNKVIKASFYQIEIGDTVIIEGRDCLYDKLGFRVSEGSECVNFPIDSNINQNEFEDYTEETWLDHSNATRDMFAKQLKYDNFNNYIMNNIDEIILYGGLHDLGKLDIEWQRKAPASDTPLAHFPFTHKKSDLRKHDWIGAYILKEHIDKIIFNMILQHHKRFAIDEGIIKSTTRWDLHSNTKDLLKEYGFNKQITYKHDEINIKNIDIISPSDKDWTTLLYLVGTLMESEILAIKEHISNSKSNI